MHGAHHADGHGSRHLGLPHRRPAHNEARQDSAQHDRPAYRRSVDRQDADRVLLMLRVRLAVQILQTAPSRLLH